MSDDPKGQRPGDQFIPLSHVKHWVQDGSNILNARGLRDAAMRHEVAEQSELPWPFGHFAVPSDPQAEAEAAQRELAAKLLASPEPLECRPLADAPGMWGIWLGGELIGGPYRREQAELGRHELDAWRRAVEAERQAVAPPRRDWREPAVPGAVGAGVTCDTVAVQSTITAGFNWNRGEGSAEGGGERLGVPPSGGIDRSSNPFWQTDDPERGR